MLVVNCVFIVLVGVQMASSSSTAPVFECACRGVRGDNEGVQELANLGLGGNITDRYVYDLEYRPQVKKNLTYDQALQKMEIEMGEERTVTFATRLKQRAASLQAEQCGLYRSHGNCVRSTMCNIDAGRLEEGRMCLACALLLDHMFFRCVCTRHTTTIKTKGVGDVLM